MNFIRDEVTSIDTENNKVTCKSTTHDYDYLIVSTGSQTNFRDNQSAIENAFEFKNITDAIDIKYLIIEYLEKASQMTDPAEKKKNSCHSLSSEGGDHRC